MGLFPFIFIFVIRGNNLTDEEVRLPKTNKEMIKNAD